jgi:D-ribose pyranose/furanose isomerase RbsD
VGDREILDAYLNPVPKNTSETDLFLHGTKALLTSVIDVLKQQVVHIMNVSV